MECSRRGEGNAYLSSLGELPNNAASDSTVRSHSDKPQGVCAVAPKRVGHRGGTL